MKRFALLGFIFALAVAQDATAKDNRRGSPRGGGGHAPAAVRAAAPRAAGHARHFSAAAQGRHSAPQLAHRSIGRSQQVRRTTNFNPVVSHRVRGNRSFNSSHRAVTPRISPVTAARNGAVRTAPRVTASRGTRWNGNRNNGGTINGVRSGNSNSSGQWRNHDRTSAGRGGQGDRNNRGGRNWTGNRGHHGHHWDRQHRNRSWWRSHFSRFALFGGGYYYWNSGYWYPAYGYDPYFSSYSYDAPLYGYNDLEPGQVIANVQRELQQRGYNAGGVDGQFGPATRQALLAYQRDAGLPVTGEIDEATLGSLGFE